MNLEYFLPLHSCLNNQPLRLHQELEDDLPALILHLPSKEKVIWINPRGAGSLETYGASRNGFHP